MYIHLAAVLSGFTYFPLSLQWPGTIWKNTTKMNIKLWLQQDLFWAIFHWCSDTFVCMGKTTNTKTQLDVIIYEWYLFFCSVLPMCKNLLDQTCASSQPSKTSTLNCHLPKKPKPIWNALWLYMNGPCLRALLSCNGVSAARFFRCGSFSMPELCNPHVSIHILHCQSWMVFQAHFLWHAHANVEPRVQKTVLCMCPISDGIESNKLEILEQRKPFTK